VRALHEGADDPLPDEGDALTALSRIAAGLSIALEEIERQRVADIRQRIDRKIMEQLRPRDLFYQILHGLRTLIDYDHSSALLLADPTRCEAELAAEQIAWHKGKSRRIGLKLPLSGGLCQTLRRGGVLGYERDGETWAQSSGEPTPGLAELLDYNRAGDGPHGVQRERCLLAAPLATRDGVIGIIKVAGREPYAFGDHEANVLEQFTLEASVAIQYLQRTESLQSGLLEAEKKHAVANLARGVSHDVNNALGAVLPLVQQMQVDIRTGQPGNGFAEDLASIERSIQICRRIFGGMLGFARGAGRKVGQGNVRRAIEGTLAILEDGMARRGIAVEVDVSDTLPPIRGGQGDLEQLFLNLSTNARDAMPSGGKLSVSARPSGSHVEVLIRDTGIGIPAEHLERIHEPFFTTKTEGYGLGLSICRSIIWEMRGTLDLQSTPESGTAVRVLLPTADTTPARSPA
jgi:signal transduction histidine kinase